MKIMDDTGFKGGGFFSIDQADSGDMLSHDMAALLTVFGGMSENVAILDTEGVVGHVNPAFEEAVGYAPDEARGMPFHALLDSGETLWADIRDTVIAGRDWRGRVSRLRRSGAPYAEDLRVLPVTGPEGGVIRMAAVGRDLSHETAIEDRLRHAQRMEALGTLAGGIAHDFNNVLYAILGYTELALERIPPDNDTQRLLKEVLQAGGRAADLVRHILAFSRQSAEQRGPVRLQLVAKEVVKLLRGTIPSTIEFRTSIQADCPKVFAEPTEIHQVLMNLCTNAYQAMAETGGILTIHLEEVPADPPAPEDRKVRLVVGDTGPGIAPELSDKVFEPYFTTRTDRGGSGMGLAIVRGIVRELGGTVTLTSNPGSGTVFTVLLPACGEEISAAPEASASGVIVPGGSESILVVDDEPAIAQVVGDLLAKLGYRITRFTSSREALDAFREDPGQFDLVVTDQTMPRPTGFDLAREMILTRPGMPVILCTGFSDLVDDEACHEAGIGAFLTKPVNASRMAAAVRRLLDQRET
jgi:PAS domain S-box-containing protein